MDILKTTDPHRFDESLDPAPGCQPTVIEDDRGVRRNTRCLADE
jgi:hypothetical protein